MRLSPVLVLSLILVATLLLSSSASPLPLADHAPQPLVSRNRIFWVISPYIKTRHNLITWLSMRIIKDPKISQARTKRSPTIGLNIANLLRVAAFPFVFLPTNFIGLQVTSTVSHLPKTFCDQKKTWLYDNIIFRSHSHVPNFPGSRNKKTNRQVANVE